MVVPLQVLILGTSSYSHICSLADIFHITDTLVYDSVLCEITYVCAIASAPVCMHACIYKIHKSHDRLICI